MGFNSGFKGLNKESEGQMHVSENMLNYKHRKREISHYLYVKRVGM